ncbi:hypothetical protein GCM10012279_44150 [Micromonospora yangpuensis]|nr:hypothetical protein GCM10012279_44150 [Micromonospora yangpuensis]
MTPAQPRSTWSPPNTTGRYDGGPDLASTVYGSGTDGPGFNTVSLPPGNPAVENSGSLTGHILAQGWSEPSNQRSSNTRVVIVLAVALTLLVAISVLVVLIGSDLMDNLLGGAAAG